MSQNPFADQKPIPSIKHILLVASGKGGVGKSTVAVNLATALAKSHKVGLLDADIYGPSIPRMMGAVGQRPISNEHGKIEPLIRHGIKLMSIGFLIEDATSVVWRGPMLFKAIDQFLNDVHWGSLDYLIIDLPPGTGDVQLTLAQKIPVTGAIVVTTPQNISLVDVKKAIDMFERTQIPVLGVIENMAYYLHPVTQEKLPMFPVGELDSYLESKHILKIGVLPFNPQIGVSCEAGIPLLTRSQDGKIKAEVQEIFDICEHIEDLLTDVKPLSDEKPTAEFSILSLQKEMGGGCGSGSCGCKNP